MQKQILVIKCQIKANAKNNSILGINEENLIKIAIKAPPQDGKANSELINFLGKTLRIPKKNITITKGLTSKLKTIEISNFRQENFLKIITPQQL